MLSISVDQKDHFVDLKLTSVMFHTVYVHSQTVRKNPLIHRFRFLGYASLHSFLAPANKIIDIRNSILRCNQKSLPLPHAEHNKSIT